MENKDMSENYMGTTRRHSDEGDRDNASPMSIVITGKRLPIIAIVALLMTIVGMLISAAIRFTSIETLAENTSRSIEIIENEHKAYLNMIYEIQHTQAMQTGILTKLAEQVAEMNDRVLFNHQEDEKWRRRILANEVEDRQIHKEFERFRDQP